MAKRFTDSEKYTKPFFRGLPGPYKLLWDYLYHDCNYAGIWIVDFEIAQIKIGKDMPIDINTALELFNKTEVRVVVLEGGLKWWIKPFVEFQYDCYPENLNPANPAHKGVIKILFKYGLISKGLESSYKAPTKGAKDKEKDKDKDKDMDKERKGGMGEKQITQEFEEKVWKVYPARNGKKVNRAKTLELFKKHIKPEDRALFYQAVKNYADSSLAKDNAAKDPQRFITNRDNATYWREWIEPEVTPEVISKQEAEQADLKENLQRERDALERTNKAIKFHGETGARLQDKARHERNISALEKKLRA